MAVIVEGCVFLVLATSNSNKMNCNHCKEVILVESDLIICSNENFANQNITIHVLVSAMLYTGKLQILTKLNGLACNASLGVEVDRNQSKRRSLMN